MSGTFIRRDGPGHHTQPVPRKGNMNSTTNIALTAQNLGRKTKSAKKSGKRVVLYVPDTFDPEVHLPEGLRHLADYARFLLHSINVGRVHLRRGNCLVYLKRDYLVKFIPKERFTAIRDALEESDVIHVRKFCVKGEMSYGYRLLDPHNQGFSLYQPTTQRLINKIVRWRKRESDTLRHPVHRELRRYVKAITIDEQAALSSVQGTAFQQAAQVAMIRRIAEGDFFSISDKFGRFHSNLTNLKKTLRPFLRYRDSELVNLDIANSQPMVFCLLLINLLSNEGKLDNLIDYEFQRSSNAYNIEIDEEFLSSIGNKSCLDSLSCFSCESSNNQLNQETGENKEKGEGEGEVIPILRRFERKPSNIINNANELRSANFSYDKASNLADDVKEFIELCEQGILYDDLMRRLNIRPSRRDCFKRLIFAQVFFGKIKKTGRVRELFARDFPTVYKAINDLKRKDHHQLAYLLQAHESKIMIDIICRKILNELPGTFIATIHDSIMTTPDKADEVKAIMMREFQRFGLNPMIRLEA